MISRTGSKQIFNGRKIGFCLESKTNNKKLLFLPWISIGRSLTFYIWDITHKFLLKVLFFLKRFLQTAPLKRFSSIYDSFEENNSNMSAKQKEFFNFFPKNSFTQTVPMDMQIKFLRAQTQELPAQNSMSLYMFYPQTLRHYFADQNSGFIYINIQTSSR